MYESISKKIKLGLVTGLSALVLSGCGVRKEESYSFDYKGVPLKLLHRDIRFNDNEYLLIGGQFKVKVSIYGQSLEIITDDNKKITIYSNELKIENYKR